MGSYCPYEISKKLGDTYFVQNEDLRGSAGMYRLREELLMRVTEAAQPVRVHDVLFQEMLVQ